MTYIAGQAYPVSSAIATTHAILWTFVESPTPPRLEITSTLAGAVNVTTLAWSNNSFFSQLQSSDSCTGLWSSVSVPTTTNGSWISVVVSNKAAPQFFRLQAN